MMILSGILMGAAIGFAILYALDVYFKKTAAILAFICAIAAVIIMFIKLKS